jgi:hypothetical protein
MSIWQLWGALFYMGVSEIVYVLLTQIVPVMAMLSASMLSYAVLLCILVSRNKARSVTRGK